jgi:PemK-like, MazF-like toxin of type II toxin-antitoxin system
MSFPRPEPGLVINYAYLWHDQHMKGAEEGRKNRPAVIILSMLQQSDGFTNVVVLPITHTPPRKANDAIEIPQSIKKHLGLDDEQSWIIVSEGNEFEWPGHDLRKINQTNRYDFGYLPPKMFNQLREAFLNNHAAGKTKAVPRT